MIKKKISKNFFKKFSKFFFPEKKKFEIFLCRLYWYGVIQIFGMAHVLKCMILPAGIWFLCAGLVRWWGLLLNNTEADEGNERKTLLRGTQSQFFPPSMAKMMTPDTAFHADIASKYPQTRVGARALVSLVLGVWTLQLPGLCGQGPSKNDVSIPY